jgi:hypothetical protein
MIYNSEVRPRHYQVRGVSPRSSQPLHHYSMTTFLKKAKAPNGLAMTTSTKAEGDPHCTFFDTHGSHNTNDCRKMLA